MRVVVGGCLVWIVPFVVSCFLIGPDGERFVSEDVFRSTMLLVGSMTGSYCCFRCDPKSTRDGIHMAIAWLIINWVLDLIILVPLMLMTDAKSTDGNKNPLTAENYKNMASIWFLRTGLAYVGFVTVCVVAGACTERAGKQRIEKKEE